MADIHIEDFYKDAARSLVQLYNAFPRKTTLYVEDIAGPDTPDEFGLHSPRHLACLSCMLWLADEGYIRFADLIRQEAMDQAVLTHKSFLLLTSVAESSELPIPLDESRNLPPAVAEEKHTLISLIRSTLATGSSIQLSKLMAGVFSR